VTVIYDYMCVCVCVDKQMNRRLICETNWKVLMQG